MKIFSIASGSSGNSYYYESGSVRLLFDAGVSFKYLREKLLFNNVLPHNIDALFVSHDHSDHASAIGVYQRMIGMPIFITPKTYHEVEHYIGCVKNILHFNSGDVVDIKHVKITTIRTPHDGVDPSIFIIDDREYRVGIFTDLGHTFNDLKRIVSDLDIIFLESNYDEELLRENSNYPEFLKRRITGKHGHISNMESAHLVKKYTTDRLKYLILSHLSESNNTENITLNTHLKVYGEKIKFKLLTAPRLSSSEVIVL